MMMAYPSHGGRICQEQQLSQDPRTRRRWLPPGGSLDLARRTQHVLTPGQEVLEFVGAAVGSVVATRTPRSTRTAPPYVHHSSFTSLAMSPDFDSPRKEAQVDQGRGVWFPPGSRRGGLEGIREHLAVGKHEPDPQV